MKGYKIMSKNNIDNLQTLLEEAQTKHNYENVASCYFELAKSYKEQGNIQKTIYYLNRFDNLVGGDDTLYENFKEEDSQATEWLSDLEIEHTPYEKIIQKQVIEKSESLNSLQKMQWLLLTMSRFCMLFQKISSLSRFEGFENLDTMVDYLCDGLYEEIDEEIEDKLSEYSDLLADVFNSFLMSDYTKKVEIKDSESFTPADLESGDIGTYFFCTAYDALQSFIFDELDEDDLYMEFAACGILADYYYRTSDEDIKNEQKIQEETARIFADYDFVEKAPDKEIFQERIRNYKNVMLV